MAGTRWRSWLRHCATSRKVAGSNVPIPVAVRSKAWVFGRSLTRIVGSNLTEGMDVCVVFVVRTVAWNVK
jgi:hypothetical protein